MKKLVLGILVLGLTQTASASKLTCATVAKSVESISDYFGQVKGDVLSDVYSEQLLRKSVAAFHYQSYDPNMSLAEADELGETVNISYVRARSGAKYILVNVGFGGGNSASYYYIPRTLEFAGVMAYDGSDCVDQGESPEFPIEKNVRVTRTAQLTCKFAEGSPFGKLWIKIPLGPNGLFFWPTAQLSLGDAKQIVPGLMIAAPKYDDTDVFYDLGRGLVGFHISASGRLDLTDWGIELSGNVGEKGGKIFGRAFPKIQGGYWSDQVKEYKVSGTCEGNLGITKVQYQRVVNF